MVSNRSEFINSWNNNGSYFDMLRLMASLSKLFSESTTPYLDYRLAENLFCKYFNAINDARSCTAYDARLGSLGIGIKTFGINSGSSTEKVAEFNRLKTVLDPLHGHDLAEKLAEFRNERIDFANNTYDVTDSIYHIVGRKDGLLTVFNTPYRKIDINNINNVLESDKSISFNDGQDSYTFNKSKSVLMKRFDLPSEHQEIEVDIIDDPLELLSSLLSSSNAECEMKHSVDTAKTEIGTGRDLMKLVKVASYKPRIKGYDYVVLPLYSTRGKIMHVPTGSGLNQWNAGGRPRDVNEVYIPVPKYIHKNYPDFFPERYTEFELVLPNGDKLSAKICQDGGKALMSNPNSALGQWILRKVLHKTPGELVTISDLIVFGIDSVLIENTHTKNSIGQSVYKISFTNSDYESYSSFIEYDD